MMIDFETFKKHMDEVEKSIRLQDKLDELFCDYGDCGGFLYPTLVDNVVSLLTKLMNDKDGWIDYFVFELDCGKDYEDGMVTDENNNNIKLSTVEDLWNILKEEHKDMNITEVQQDLFLVPQGYYLAHCISGDYALGAGIAKKFDEVYNMRFKLHKNYPIPEGESYANVNQAILIDNVFNLVTKPRHWHKPSYFNVEAALEDMKRQCIEKDITKIAMPLIGCGLDRLQWDKVKEVIEKVFGDTDIQIMVCRL